MRRPTLSLPAISLPRSVWSAFAAAGLLVLLQQQLLEQRPPRLLEVVPQPHSSGPGALDLRFSRPMQRASLAAGSRLAPPLAHRWLGSDGLQRLLLQPSEVVTRPLTLELSGADRRGRRLPAQLWRWDPRPHLVVVAQVPGGEQLKLRRPDGRWMALSPVWGRILSLEPLADGRGVVFLAGNHHDQLQLWKRHLRPRSLVPGGAATSAPQLGTLERLWSGPLSFAHVSSNRRGDLLLQLGGSMPGQQTSLWIDPQGRRRSLDLEVSGPIRLLPEGDGMVVPTPDGLELRGLENDSQRPQVLPGSRVLASFCPASGEAVLMRHWPDYRRSVERVQPGSAPITLWLGGEAVMAAGCNPSGNRIWMLLNRWQNASSTSMVLLDGRGRTLARHRIDPWIPEPGTPLSYDPVGDQLLFTVRRDPREPARAALMEGRSLKLRLLPEPISQAVWLPAS